MKTFVNKKKRLVVSIGKSQLDAVAVAKMKLADFKKVFKRSNAEEAHKACVEAVRESESTAKEGESSAK